MRFRYSKRKMVKLSVNSEDPDQTPHSAASDLGLHCLPITLLGVSRLQWVNKCVDWAIKFQINQSRYCILCTDDSQITETETFTN